MAFFSGGILSDMRRLKGTGKFNAAMLFLGG
jgi:hypothetical protein